MKLKITIDEKTYEVEVEPLDPETAPQHRPLYAEPAAVRIPAAVPPPAPAASAQNVNEAKVCRSPVSGIVVRVATQVGQTLQVGDVLLVLEAMKMETSVTAPVVGKVAAIKAASGDSVQSGQILVEFE